MSLPPSLMFSRYWDNIIAQKKIKLNEINNITRVNVVMHVCTENNFKRSYLRYAFGCRGKPSTKIQNSVTRSGQKLGQYSSSDLDSPFEHLRFNAEKAGKILVFRNKRNIIRAGKSTHADAFYSVLKFIDWSQCNKQDWYTGIATPNSVVSGEFNTPITEKFRTSPHVSFSDKFPGISVNVAHALSTTNNKETTCCTPEVYRSGKFIIPGIKTPADLVSSCIVLNDLAHKYK